MKNANSHIILYAKNHYKRTDMMEDLRILVGQRSMCYPKQITDNDIIIVVLDITLPFILNAGDPARILIEFFNDIHPLNRWKIGIDENADLFVALVRKCMSFLRYLSVHDDTGKVVVELDPPDFTILPQRPPEQQF